MQWTCTVRVASSSQAALLSPVSLPTFYRSDRFQLMARRQSRPHLLKFYGVDDVILLARQDAHLFKRRVDPFGEFRNRIRRPIQLFLKQ